MVQLEDKQALIVDGDAHSLAVTSGLLRELRIGFKRNMTGSNVLEQLRAMPHRPDFILINLDLPFSDGISVGAALYRDPQWRGVPIILIGSEDESAVALRVQQYGFAAYIRKPLPKRLFGQIILRVLAGEHLWEVAV